MAAGVCLLRPMCSREHYRPIPVSVCTKLVTSSRFLPWPCVNLHSTNGFATGVLENATRRVPVRPLRFRITKAITANESTTDLKYSDAALRKGVLLEFSKEIGKYVLAVIQKPEGKRNWLASDQFGNVYSVKPQQVTFIVPGIEDFNIADIATFIIEAETLQDLSLLEFAWEELVEANKKNVNAIELAKMCYGDGPVEYYAAHRLLISQQLYFRYKQKGPSAIFEPRSLLQVNDLKQRQSIENAARQELLEYVNDIRRACDQPFKSKPPPNYWQSSDYFSARTHSLRAYALEISITTQQRQSAEEVLDALKISKEVSVAVDLLIKMGVFPVHVNLEVLKSGVPIEFSTEFLQAAQHVVENFPLDTNLKDRVDLTHLKVYTIDSEDADEIDDGLSAARLPDGRMKVWIHVADPTRWVPSMHILDKEAKRRSTSIYLPTGAIPMFPMELASTLMSLRQGYETCAISVSVIFQPDGSIAESQVMISTIRPTYRLSHGLAFEHLQRDDEEEPDLHLLDEVAKIRQAWRTAQDFFCSDRFCTRYWAIEYLRRHPRGTQFQALVLRFMRKGELLVLIQKLGIQAQAEINSATEIGSEITVMVDSAYPRKDILILRQV